MSKKDLHITFRVNDEIQGFFDRFTDEIRGKVGKKDIPQSKILRGLLAIMNGDGKLREQVIKRIARYLEIELDRW